MRNQEENKPEDYREGTIVRFSFESALSNVWKCNGIVTKMDNGLVSIFWDNNRETEEPWHSLDIVD